jgi:hypothetical protein
MILGQVFQSAASWQKLSGINMKPKIAYAILKYSKLVGVEHGIIEEMRVALIRKITGTEEGKEARIEPNTLELAAYVEEFNKVLVAESSLKPLDMIFEDVVNAVDDGDESLTVSDLAMLEPFFLSSGNEAKAE